MSVRDDYHRQGREMEDGAGDTIERYRRVSQDAIAPLTQEALFTRHEPGWPQRADAATTMFDPATVLTGSI